MVWTEKLLIALNAATTVTGVMVLVGARG
jgi:hypothetical protein